MPASPHNPLLADAVLLLHFGVVLFIVGGLILIVAGNRLGWRWVNDGLFRLAHLAAIGVVVAEAWLAVACPLTTLETWLRGTGPGVSYDAGFFAYWMQRLLFFDAPGWVFTALYSGFAGLVVAAWWVYPPRRKPQSR